MKKEEFEDFIFDLMEKIHKNKSEFIIDKKIKDLLEEFYLFREIISNFPDKYNSILNEILSNLNLKKYSKKEVVFDNNIESINDIFIIFKGEIIINNYISIEEIESNEKEEINQNKENITVELILKKGEIFSKNYLIKKYKIKRKYNENGELIVNEKVSFNIISKSKSILGIITEKNYYNILEKYKTKERLESINFLQKIEYLSNDLNFIEKFQKILIKRCFSKNSIISEQNEKIKSIYLIISGTVRLSMIFNKTIYCSLDYDVLKGKLINERFSSSRLFEITGNYREKEKMDIIDLNEGEIIGGIELCKKLENYLFRIECKTDVKLYEIDINYFKRILGSWKLKKFYTKINNQIKILKDRISNINNLVKEKNKKDNSISSSQNKFLEVFKKGHPLNKKDEEYINKYIHPFKFEKLIISKQFKFSNIKYSKTISSKLTKGAFKNKNKIIYKKVNSPFITSLVRQNNNSKRNRSLSVPLDLKQQSKKSENDFNDQLKENNNNIYNLKLNKINNNNSSKKKNIITKKRFNSCKLEKKTIIKISPNLIMRRPNIKDFNNSKFNTVSGGISLTNRLHSSVDSIKLIKNDLYNEENKNMKLKNSFSTMNSVSIPNKELDLIIQKTKKLYKPPINKKILIFPHGIQDIFEHKGNNIKKIIINKIMKGRFINEEFNLKRKTMKS